jgi:hypothetical protein
MGIGAIKLLCLFQEDASCCKAIGCAVSEAFTPYGRIGPLKKAYTPKHSERQGCSKRRTASEALHDLIYRAGHPAARRGLPISKSPRVNQSLNQFHGRDPCAAFIKRGERDFGRASCQTHNVAGQPPSPKPALCLLHRPRRIPDRQNEDPATSGAPVHSSLRLILQALRLERQHLAAPQRVWRLLRDTRD